MLSDAGIRPLMDPDRRFVIMFYLEIPGRVRVFRSDVLKKDGALDLAEPMELTMLEEGYFTGRWVNLHPANARRYIERAGEFFIGGK